MSVNTVHILKSRKTKSKRVKVCAVWSSRIKQSHKVREETEVCQRSAVFVCLRDHGQPKRMKLVLIPQTSSQLPRGYRGVPAIATSVQFPIVPRVLLVIIIMVYLFVEHETPQTKRCRFDTSLLLPRKTFFESVDSSVQFSSVQRFIEWPK